MLESSFTSNVNSELYLPFYDELDPGEQAARDIFQIIHKHPRDGISKNDLFSYFRDKMSPEVFKW